MGSGRIIKSERYNTFSTTDAFHTCDFKKESFFFKFKIILEASASKFYFKKFQKLLSSHPVSTGQFLFCSFSFLTSNNKILYQAA